MDNQDVIKVLIVDDHRVVREGISAILNIVDDIEVLGEAKDGQEAIEQARTLQPDVVLISIWSSGASGMIS